ncbi:hypothetical protein GKD24_09310 [Lactobacillus paracasei]|nr:hypothetical protein [Lacticaseibacillus paracasei]PTS55849.1 hypothetical protein DBQ61_11335 [Lactobacillus sp. DS22_6]MSC31135.1 hypothetical protein [Lacticaseibacillus paracasei]MSC37490.1 hypothetical protein [Lacticaseibacillus paracasei]MSC43830.1 hypothetical protein [Lacticaseibacillus paracasei]
MLLGDFETAGFAGSKRRHSVPAPAGRRLRSLARQGNFSQASPCDYSEFNASRVLRWNYDAPSFSQNWSIELVFLTFHDLRCRRK